MIAAWIAVWLAATFATALVIVWRRYRRLQRRYAEPCYARLHERQNEHSCMQPKGHRGPHRCYETRCARKWQGGTGTTVLP